MQFTHESAIVVPGAVDLVHADWSDITCLPQILTHVRATAVGDSDDLGRMVILLDGNHIEFDVQRTMCDSSIICWQNLGTEVDYILTVSLSPADQDARVVVNCTYDPHGILPDILETLGLSHTFQHDLENDLKRYADVRAGAQSCPPSGVAPGIALHTLGMAGESG
ncbi:MAG: hypothetical protein ACLQVD_01605 [Capsulimonadaceae bacterium]